MSERDRIAEVVAAHERLHGECYCGRDFRNQGWAWALHVADALIAAGVRILECPEGCPRTGAERDGCSCVYPKGHPSEH